MHEIHGGVGCCRARRRHEETSTGVGRQRFKRKLLANGHHRMRWRACLCLCLCLCPLVCRPGHPVAWPPSAVERMSRHDEVTVHTLRHAKTTSPALAIQRKGCAYSPARQRPLRAWSYGRCRNRLWRWC
jgi:hypothetical protein